MGALIPAARSLAVACLALGLAGCGSGDVDDEAQGATLTVYVSAPLRGETGDEGRAIVRGAKLALADAGGESGGLDVEAIYMDDTGGAGEKTRWDPAVVADNARRAAQDSTAIAYIGEVESGATRVSLPITNQARMLHVSAASTATDLVRDRPGSNDVPELFQPTGERTFGRVIPDDEAQARAAARWAQELDAERVAVATDDADFADAVASAFTREAAALGLAVSEHDREKIPCPPPRPLYLAGVPDALAPRLVPGDSEEPVIASDAFLGQNRVEGEAIADCADVLRITSSAQDPEQLPPAGRAFARTYERQFDEEPDRYAAYGHEAMALVLDSIDRAAQSRSRSDVVDAFFATRERDSVLGTYSIDAVGNTTLDAIAGYRLDDGEPRFAMSLSVP